MKKNFAVYNSEGMGGPPAAPPSPKNKPLPFRKDGFVGHQLRVEDAIRVQEHQKVEIDLQWLKDALSFFDKMNFFSKFSVEKKPQVKSESQLLKNVQQFMKTVFTPVVVTYNFTVKTVEWIQKTCESAMKFASKVATKVGQMLMVPINRFLLRPLNIAYTYVSQKLEAAKIWTTIKYQAVAARVNAYAQATKAFLMPVAKLAIWTYNLATRPLETMREAARELSEIVKRTLTKASEWVEKKVTDITAPLIQFVQQIPDQIAMASLWVLNSKPVQFFKTSVQNRIRNVINVVKWCQGQGKRGAQYLAKIIKKPLKLIEKAAEAVSTAFLSVFDMIVGWISKLAKAIFQVISRIMTSIANKVKAMVIGLRHTPKYFLKFGRFLLSRLGKLTVWMNTRLGS